MILAFQLRHYLYSDSRSRRPIEDTVWRPCRMEFNRESNQSQDDIQPGIVIFTDRRMKIGSQ